MVITKVKEDILRSPRLSDYRGKFDGVVVIGGANIDLRGKPVGEMLERHTSNPGKICVGSGGVGRNIAHSLALLNVPVCLLSAVGDDGEGVKILEETEKAGVIMEQMIISGEYPTGIYLAILDERGEMEVGISDMRILEEITVEYLKSKAYLIKESKIVVMDTNIPVQSIEYVVDLCNKVKVPILVEPASVEKAKKLMKILDGSGRGYIDYLTPNKDELESILGTETETETGAGAETETEISEYRDMDLERAAEELNRRGVKKVIVTLGKRGIYVYNDGSGVGDAGERGLEDELNRFFLAPYKGKVVDVTGAGDALVAGLVYGIYKGYPLEVAAKFGLGAAALTISTKETVRRDLREGLLKSRIEEEK
ncbi:MAG TPA: ribokinase [Candidatus Atribacteria bacterium]|nr:ribokinase [Candidatus Atribacteria bacterium]